MRRAVHYKFETHADIRTILFATDDELIVEAAEHDSYWGCGADGKGSTAWGGTTLMDVRRALRQQPDSSQPQTA